LAIESDERLPKDVQITVSQDGKQVKVADAKAGWTLPLAPGRYKLAVRGGQNHFRLDCDSVNVTRGAKEVVHILQPLRETSAPFDADEARWFQERWAGQLERPIEYKNSVGMEFVVIPPGEFVMGSPHGIAGASPDDAEKWSIDPLEHERGHTGWLHITRPYYLGIYEVTQEQYRQVMGVNPSHFSEKGQAKDAASGRDYHGLPVENVSWDDAREFCVKLSERSEEKGRHYRLPTEAEWEYACRAGTQTTWHFGDDPARLKEYGWCQENSGGTTHEVGRLAANPWGLFDMYGNVWELCLDDYLDTYYGRSPLVDPCCESTTDMVVQRGGGVESDRRRCRSALRNHCFAGAQDKQTGFRVLLEIGTPQPPREPPRQDDRETEIKRPPPVHVELKPEPGPGVAGAPAFEPGQPLSEMALVVRPAAVKGATSWTLETVRSRGGVAALAFNSDGQKLACGGEDGTIRIIDPLSGTLFRALVGHNRPLRALSWSPDDTMLVSAGDGGPAIVWDVESGQVLRHDLFGGEVAWAEWSPDGGRIAGLACTGQDVVILDLVHGSRKEIPCQDLETDVRATGCLAWAPDGKALAYFRTEAENPAERDLCIWDVEKPGEVRRMGIKTKGMRGLAWSPDGSTLAEIDWRAWLFNVETGQQVKRLPEWAAAVAWSPDGRRIACGESGWHNNGVQVRNWTTGSVVWQEKGIGPRTALAFAPEDRCLASASDSNRILAMLDVKTGAKTGDWNGHDSAGCGGPVVPTGDGARLAVRPVTGGPLRLYDLGTMRPAAAVDADQSHDVAWSADGSTLAVLDGGRIRIMDAATLQGGHQIPFNHPQWQASCSLALSSDGALVVKWEDGTTSVWDVASEKPLCEISKASKACSLNADGSKLAIACENGVKLYDPQTGTELGALDGAQGPPEAVAWSPGGKLLAGVGGTSAIDLWDVASGKHLPENVSLTKVASLQKGGTLKALAWLDDKTLLIGNRGAAVVWDMPSRKVLRTIPGTGAGETCWFAPRARKVVFAGASLVRVRCLDDGRLTSTIVLLSGDPRESAFLGPDGHWRGKPELAEKSFVYVVQTDRGQETLTPDEFESKYSWKNDPAKVP
jgi:formylglycine-generating enzyme required for sulfatase activity/WD40 repeat protein